MKFFSLVWVRRLNPRPNYHPKQTTPDSATYVASNVMPQWRSMSTTVPKCATTTWQQSAQHQWQSHTHTWCAQRGHHGDCPTSSRTISLVVLYLLLLSQPQCMCRRWFYTFNAAIVPGTIHYDLVSMEEQVLCIEPNLCAIKKIYYSNTDMALRTPTAMSE